MEQKLWLKRERICASLEEGEYELIVHDQEVRLTHIRAHLVTCKHIATREGTQEDGKHMRSTQKRELSGTSNHPNLNEVFKCPVESTINRAHNVPA